MRPNLIEQVRHALKRVNELPITLDHLRHADIVPCVRALKHCERNGPIAKHLLQKWKQLAPIDIVQTPLTVVKNDRDAKNTSAPTTAAVDAVRLQALTKLKPQDDGKNDIKLESPSTRANDEVESKPKVLVIAPLSFPDALSHTKLDWSKLTNDDLTSTNSVRLKNKVHGSFFFENYFEGKISKRFSSASRRTDSSRCIPCKANCNDRFFWPSQNQANR
jgi:hypothetical protein